MEWEELRGVGCVDVGNREVVVFDGWEDIEEGCNYRLKEEVYRIWSEEYKEGVMGVLREVMKEFDVYCVEC